MAERAGRTWGIVAAFAVTAIAALVLPTFTGVPSRDTAPPEVALPLTVRTGKGVLWFVLLIAAGFLPGRWGLHGRDFGVSVAATIALRIEIGLLLDDAFGSTADGDAYRTTPSAATNKSTSNSPGTIR